MKKRTLLPFPELYSRLKPIDKLALILFVDDMELGINSEVKTRFADNSLTALSYAGLVMATQEPHQFPKVKTVTARGLKFNAYIKQHTTVEELASQLPDKIMKRMRG